MATQRTVSLTPSTMAFLRLAVYAPTMPMPTARSCQHAVRRFSAAASLRASSKRKMQTSTAFTPYTLTQPPPLPRSADVNETSIAGPTAHEIESTDARARGHPFALPEQEAQKSTSVATPSPAPATKPRPKLRARKAAMKLTPEAVAHLRALLDQPTPRIIKVGVKNKGCSGLAYDLHYVDKASPFDETVEQDGVKVLIDSKALMTIIGSEMDWVEDKLNQRFVFRNPNIKEQCGCGESFMV